MMKTISDLPPELVGKKILSKVPITSLGQVRSTCKLWDRLTREWTVGKEVAARQQQHQFLGFVTVDYKVCSLRFRKEEEDVDLSVKQVGGLLNQFEILDVFHCDGLLLCIPKDDKSKLLVWNPYLGQIMSISPRTGDNFHAGNTYLLGYDMNRNHKMLNFHGYVFELYEFCSNSWKVLEDTLPDNLVDKYGGHIITSLKGDAYLLSQEFTGDDDAGKDVIMCFDFTRETFGPPMHVPFLSKCEEAVTLSSFRDQKLAVLHQKGQLKIEALEIWITTEEGPFNPHADVTWSKFMDVDMRPLIGDRYIRFGEEFASFFIIGDDKEEKKVAVVLDTDGYEFCMGLGRDHYHTAFIIGDKDGYYKTVSLGLAPNLWKPPASGIYPSGGYIPQFYHPPLVTSSSYLPSLVQLNHAPPQ